VSSLCACEERSDGDNSRIGLLTVSVHDEIDAVVDDGLVNVNVNVNVTVTVTVTVHLTDFAAVLFD
jgi:hypothetical protein